jgi:hypothetical protein
MISALSNEKNAPNNTQNAMAGRVFWPLATEFAERWFYDQHITIFIDPAHRQDK